MSFSEPEQASLNELKTLNYDELQTKKSGLEIVLNRLNNIGPIELGINNLDPQSTINDWQRQIHLTQERLRIVAEELKSKAPPLPEIIPTNTAPGQTNKIPILLIIAGIGILIVVAAVAKRKKRN